MVDQGKHAGWQEQELGAPPDWNQVRAEFPVLDACAYLNTGTYGPLPRRAIAALSAQAERELAEGRSGETYNKQTYAWRDQLRAELATVIGAQTRDICLTRATTEAMNIALGALRLGPEDQVVTTDLEHHTLPTALKSAGVKVRVVALRAAPYEEIVSRIADAVGPRTELIALSHVDWASGAVLPIPAIAKLGPPVLVDGAQSAGAIPFDVSALACAFFAFPGQKWLVGPDGTGALYVHPDYQERLIAPTPSTYGHDTQPDGRDIPFPGAARFDPGPIALAELNAFRAALTLVGELGFARLERARELTDRFAAALAEQVQVIPCTERATLISFLPPSDPDETVARLAAAGVQTRTIPDRGWVRASIGYWNNEDDLARLLDGLGHRS